MTTPERIARMTVVEKLRIALNGSPEERAILIQDANQLVPAAVLSSPLLTNAEVEAYAAMPAIL